MWRWNDGTLRFFEEHRLNKKKKKKKKNKKNMNNKISSDVGSIPDPK